jgi:two-component system response regulator FixJ
MAEHQRSFGSDTPSTLYIVDDDQAIRSAITLLAYSMGWRARPYASAPDFLANYRRSERDCLVLDLRMPGMNGVELLEELGSRGITIPTVVITAQKDDTLVGRAQTAGAAVVLTKPFRNQILIKHIKNALEIEEHR